MIPIFKKCSDTGVVEEAGARPDQIETMEKFGWSKEKPSENSAKKVLKKALPVEEKTKTEKENIEK